MSKVGGLVLWVYVFFSCRLELRQIQIIEWIG